MALAIYSIAVCIDLYISVWNSIEMCRAFYELVIIILLFDVRSSEVYLTFESSIFDARLTRMRINTISTKSS